MRYLGGKSRIAKEVVSLITSVQLKGQVFIEPFVGGCNITPLVQGTRVANDISLPLISLLKAVQNGWEPPSVVTEHEYKRARNLEDTNPLKGFIGFGCSYGGRYFGGYARCSQGRNYAEASARGLLKIAPLIKDVLFTQGSYSRMRLPAESLIYCDPPYWGATGYDNSINYREFYEWCRAARRAGHSIFVSEYRMPKDFICVWEKKCEVIINKSATSRGIKVAIERVFTLP